MYRTCPTNCRLRINDISLRQFFDLDDFWERRSDLSELSFNVCVEHSPPLQIVPGDGQRPTGFFPDLFYEVKVSVRLKEIIIELYSFSICCI